MSALQTEPLTNQEELSIIKQHLQNSLSKSMPSEKVKSILTKLDMLYAIEEYMEQKNGKDPSETVYTITEEELMEFATEQLDIATQKLNHITQKIDAACDRMEKMESKRG